MKTFKKVKLKFGSMVNQCPSCGEMFNSLCAFDKHRTGEYGKPVKNGYSTHTRRCRSREEMSDIGMKHNSRGYWISATMGEREDVRRRKL